LDLTQIVTLIGSLGAIIGVYIKFVSTVKALIKEGGDQQEKLRQERAKAYAEKIKALEEKYDGQIADHSREVTRFITKLVETDRQLTDPVEGQYQKLTKIDSDLKNLIKNFDSFKEKSGQ